MSIVAGNRVPERIEAPANLTPVQESALRRSALRLIPFLAAASFIHYIDRVNVAFAALSMNRDLGLTASQFGTAAGVFYIGFVVMMVPSNLAAYRIGARRWIGRIMILWGLCGVAKAFAVGPISLAVIRFIEGAAQAGFFPGVIFYLTLWFPAAYRTRTLAWFLVAIPLSSVVGGPLSVALLEMDGALGLEGWQWLFILESLPAVVLGFFSPYILADRPADAYWLTKDERGALADMIGEESRGKEARSFLDALKDKRVLVLGLIFLLMIVGVLGPAFWMPLILKSHGLSDAQANWVSAAPNLVASVAMIVWARFMDRTGHHALHLMAAFLIAAAGFILAVAYNAFIPALIGLTVALSGLAGARPAFYSIPPRFLHGAAAASGIGFINSMGSLGGFIGSVSLGWLKDATGSFSAGLYSFAGALLLAALLTLSLRVFGREA